MMRLTSRYLALAISACLAAILASALPQPAYPYAGVPQAAWVSTFDDDFDGDAVNTSTWHVAANWTHCSPCEPQLYVPGAISVADSILTITTNRSPIVGPGGQVFNFSSGWLDTKASFAQTYGLFETRARLPPQNATGIWPAFWSLPHNSSICWPMGGEIDVFEYTANQLTNQVFGSYRWGTSCGNNQQLLPGAGYPPSGQPAIDWSADFHVFAITWNATTLSFYVDGQLYETKTPGEVGGVMPAPQQYLILDVAVAWYWMPGPDAAYPAQTQFDYVRAFAWPAAS